jgi:uncharacterized protein with HEPN domain
MKKENLIYIQHILESVEKIQKYTDNKTIDLFLEDTLLQDAIIRNLEIIGEASKKVDLDFKVKYPTIEWKKMAGMRDKLIHDYIGVDLWAVWGVVEKILPDLKINLKSIIENERTTS